MTEPFKFNSLLNVSGMDASPKMNQIFIESIPSDTDENTINGLIKDALIEADYYVRCYPKWDSLFGEPTKKLTLKFDNAVEISAVQPLIDGAVRKGLYLAGYDGEAVRLNYIPHIAPSAAITLQNQNTTPKPKQP